MYNFLEKVLEVKKGLSTSAFAREIGMQQKTVDLYLKGERKPSVEFVRNICSRFSVSSDWLLGLSNAQTQQTVVSGNSGVIAVGVGAKAISNLSQNCEDCKFKKLADAFKAI